MLSRGVLALGLLLPFANAQTPRTEADAPALEAQRLMGGAPGAALLPAPKLLSPAGGATFDHYPRQTTLVWSAVPGAASYSCFYVSVLGLGHAEGGLLRLKPERHDA